MKQWVTNAYNATKDSLTKPLKSRSNSTGESQIPIGEDADANDAPSIMQTRISSFVSKAENLATGVSKETKSALASLSKRFNRVADESPSLTDEEKLQKSIESLSGKDRVGLLGEGAATVLGGLGGAAAASSVASAAGASTLLGSTTLASALGGVFVTTTPVGWIIGSTLVLSAVGYSAGKLIRSGSAQDKIRAELINSLNERLAAIRTSQAASTDMNELKQLCAVCIAGGVIDQLSMDRMLGLIESGAMPISIAIDRLARKAEAASLIERTVTSGSGI